MLDAVISGHCQIQFDLIWRRGSTDMLLATTTETYDPVQGNFDAQPHEYDLTAPEVVFEAGDQFVFRYTAIEISGPEAYYPNGDGVLKNGRIPHFVLPK